MAKREQAFMKLFRGLDRAHGKYTVKDTDKGKAKVNGVAITIIEPVTETLWKAHLDGKQGLGIMPLMDNNHCWFGVIDVDKYPLDFDELEAKVKQHDLPLVITRSKSGGAHLWLFCKEEVSADRIISTLTEWSVILGYAGCEIFPKQTKLASQRDVGNWINIPYFNAGSTTRYAIKAGKSLSITKFLEHAEKLRVTALQLSTLKPKINDDLVEGPPCLQYLASQRISEGGRNSALFNFGIYCRLRYPDNWVEALMELNNKYMVPPVMDREFDTVIKSLKKTKYFYTCKQAPICNHCNQTICKTRQFGIGNDDEEVSLVLGTLTKILTKPPIWVMDVDGVRIELTTEELTSQEKFRKKCVEAINKLPPRIKALRFDKLIMDRLDNCEEVEAPDDAGPEGTFLHYFNQFCTGTLRTENKDQLLVGRVWVNEDKIYFRVADLLRYLDQQRYKQFNERGIWSVLKREYDAGHRTFSIKGVRVATWYVMKPVEAKELDVPQNLGTQI